LLFKVLIHSNGPDPFKIAGSRPKAETIKHMQNPLILTKFGAGVRFAAFHTLRLKARREGARKQGRHRNGRDQLADYQIFLQEKRLVPDHNNLPSLGRHNHLNCELDAEKEAKVGKRDRAK
jgi:hypothetical protein